MFRPADYFRMDPLLRRSRLLLPFHFTQHLLQNRKETPQLLLQHLPLLHYLLIVFPGHSSQLRSKPLIYPRVEDLPEDPGFVPGRGSQKPGKLSLGYHGNLLELGIIQRQNVLQSGVHLLDPLQNLLLGQVKDGILFLPGQRAPASLFPGAHVFRIAAYTVYPAPVLHLQFHIGRSLRLCEVAADPSPFLIPHLAAQSPVQGISDGVKKSGLARPGGSGDQEQSLSAQPGELHRLHILIGSPPAYLQSNRLHAAPFRTMPLPQPSGLNKRSATSRASSR